MPVSRAAARLNTDDPAGVVGDHQAVGQVVGADQADAG